MDSILVPYLTSTDSREADVLLGDLLQVRAAPLVRRILAHRLGSSSPDLQDLSSSVLLQLLVRLRQGRSDATLEAIQVFDGYVATTARHACDHHLRAKYPLRWRLRSRILYVLMHDQRFATWKTDDGIRVCGRNGWEPQPIVEWPVGQGLVVSNGDIRGLLQRMFDVSAAPLELSDVVDVAATVWGIPLQPLAHEAVVDILPSPAPRVDESIDQRQRLQRTWSRICELPLRQRHALLLNMADDGLSLFLTTAATTFRDFAAALEISVDEFAALWNDLPLPDNAIAARLGVTRQQVINLRMSARKRLGNRMARED